MGFLQLVLLLNSNFKSWRSNKTQKIIPVFLLTIEICFIAEYVANFGAITMRCLEEGVYSFALGWNVL